ncbi:MAG: molecular chaperone HtpG [Anaerolineaceae bacterium]|nr:molecular chaperone HtpG [Anaerolineaceae bacterium]
MAETYNFQAEIQQVLDILVHSLYTEREIFLRELISNASDALNRVQFEMLTNRDVQDADAELAIEIKVDEEAGTITISDTGIGMTRDDLINNLGVIARSGAKAFIQAMKDSQNGGGADIIGQFGVGFYSVFMVADKIQITTRSYKPEEPAYVWESTGVATYTIEEGTREARGTDIVVYLKEDAKEFASEWKVRDIIRRHSDYIAFPIYVGEGEEAVNKQQAIWRQDPKEITDEQYNDFYKMLTLDWNAPLYHIHMRADVPLQFYALLYIPGGNDLGILSPRKEPGLKLYARKVLIQEYNKDLLPEYLGFVQGVVDSEDLPLNVSRESVQANRIMANLKKTLTNRVLTELKRMAEKDRENYLEIYEQFGRFIKQGIAASPTDRTDIEPLLFFASTRSESPDELFTLEEYIERRVEGQDDIYYIIGEDFHSVSRSPHLDAFRQRGIEVLYFTDPVDPFMLMGLPDYKSHTLRSVDEADIDLSTVGQAVDEETVRREPLPEDTFTVLRDHFAAVLGGRVRDVRQSKSLTGSPARLVSDESGASRQMFRINRLLDRDYELPVKVLELNPRHPLLHNLSGMLQHDADNPLVNVVVEQVFETALLQDGIHPDPSAMAARLNLLMQAATGTPVTELDYEAVRTPAPEAAEVVESEATEAEDDAE